MQSLQSALDRTGAGVWHDFPRQAGGKGSNVWATAFIAAHLGRIDEGRSLAAGAVEQLLSLHRPSGGWGYDERILEDCDSTAWVLLAAAKAGVKVPRELLLPALRFILAHQHPGGGFVTYGELGPRVFGEIAARQGWFEPVPCVSAAALAALATYAPAELPAIQDGLCWLLAQRDAELWQPYWWYGFAYATYHGVAAVQQAKAELPRTLDRTLHAVLAARNDDGGFSGLVPGESNVFATALALLTIAALDPDRLGDHADAVQLLLDAQRDHGGWEGVAELRVPGGITEEILTMTDQGPFTTACVLHALDEVRRAL